MNARRPLLGLLAGAALLLVLSVVFLSTSPPRPEPEVPLGPSRELDEAAEEVRAVATGMRRLEEMISDQGAQLREFGESLLQVRHRVGQLEQRPPEPEAPAAGSPPSPATGPGTAAPPPRAQAFDLDALVHPEPVAVPAGPAAAFPSRSLAWVEPVGSGGASRYGREQAAADAGSAAGPAPRFFIPPSILSGVSLTALVGRIPRGGAVQDPWPFAVVSRLDNVTASGVRLPQLRGILWRGVVRGDAVLSCASASIRSLVYVFDDGVFHVAQAPGPDGFGYLADKSGNPCLAGEIHSTAPADMGTHLLAGVLAGAGGAFAESQLRRNLAAGTETTSVEGDAFSYLLGQTVQGAASTYGDYLLRYANDTWDAVVVPAGSEVDIHIADAIPIVHAPERRIHASPSPLVAVSRGGLD